jgi:hypothetical protein
MRVDHKILGLIFICACNELETVPVNMLIKFISLKIVFSWVNVMVVVDMSHVEAVLLWSIVHFASHVLNDLWCSQNLFHS